MPLFAVVAERLNHSEPHKTDSTHKLVSSGFRTPLSRSRCTSGESLYTSMRPRDPPGWLATVRSPPGRSAAVCTVPSARDGFEDCYSTPRTPSSCTRRRYPFGTLEELPCPPQTTVPLRGWPMRSCPVSRMGAESSNHYPQT